MNDLPNINDLDSINTRKLHLLISSLDHWTKGEDFLRKPKHGLEIGSDHTIVDWRNFCRDICDIYYTNNQRKIEGNFQSKYSKRQLQHL